MYNSKLYSILEHFNKYEQNRCRKYIQSPYFNKAQELIDLYEIFIKRINSASQRSFTKEIIWKKLVPKKTFDDVRFRKFCSDLLKLVEGYLGQQIYEDSRLEHATNLMQSISKRKLDKLYNSTISSARRLSEKQPFRNADYYLHQYKIENSYYSIVEEDSKRSVKTDGNVEKIANNLDYFYLSEKLRLLCTAIARQKFKNQEYNLLFIEDILKNAERKEISHILPIAIYYRIFLVNSFPEEKENYYQLKSQLSQHSLKFPQDEAYSMYIFAINYCILNINKGNSNFLEELFELYNDLINKEIIFIKNELSPWTLKNIVVIALRLGKYNWTENFINKYKDRLPEASRENAVTYNLAQVYFYQKKYEKVIPLLHAVEYEDLSYNLGSKSMLIATYYETDEIEPLYHLFESFRTYLNRHKDIPANRRKNYGNLIKYTKKLTRIRPGDNAALKKLKEEVENTKNIASINWLKEKIAELE